MNEPLAPEEPRARLRRRRPVTWVWVVPIIAAGIVAWLAWRSLAERGPRITISFSSGKGLQARQSTIQRRGVEVGTIESLQLSSDLSKVIVHARMNSAAEPFLDENTRFYVVAPRVGPEGISGLSTLVSGSYIEMSPGQGHTRQRHFTGLEDPPAMHEESSGTSFTLRATELGSLTRGAPVSYRGAPVGNVDGFVLAADGSHIDVSVFVRGPYDALVHQDSRFWNAGGIDLTADARGIRVKANSWQQLLSGGIEFDTPVLASARSRPDVMFRLYENRHRASRDPRGAELVCVANFSGNLRGIGPGSSVELHGVEVGEVRSSQLEFDSKRRVFTTRVVFAIASDFTEDLNPAAGAPQSRAALEGSLTTLLADGLHAQVASANFLTGLKLIALDITGNAPKSQLVREGGYIRIPTISSDDLGEILASLKGVLNNLNKATGGPEIGRSLKSLDATLANVEQITRTAGPEVQSLLKSLRAAADSAQESLTSIRGAVGTASSSGDLSQLLQDLSRTSRSVRELAEYLERHPESLLRGRQRSEP